MNRYLYGACVQGIQNFIFQTNKLLEIVGASDLVEQICTEAFSEFSKDAEVIVAAAGNIKCIFASKEACQQAVLRFPQKVMEMAPGITISQAVLPFDDNAEFGDCIMRLEELLHIQRNKPMPSTTLGIMGVQRSRRTGLPSIKKDTYLDKSSFAKLYTCDQQKRDAKKLSEKAFGLSHISHAQFAHDIAEITNSNDWIAVVHADGNGLGKVVQTIGKDKERLKAFSKKLSQATCQAAQRAFNLISKEGWFVAEKFIPIRPIVLGGDDFTMICQADFAIEYTQAFLRFFEEETKKMLQTELEGVFEEKCLSACAGIAFIKSSYPFYYGYELAETLCTQAKNVAKADKHTNGGSLLPKSCLMFHKVQDSFVEDYESIEQRELMPQPNISWKFGPYYVNEADAPHWTIQHLLEEVDALQKDSDARAVKNHVRQWMSVVHTDVAQAEQYRKRMLSIISEKNHALAAELTSPSYTCLNEKAIYPAYDVLAINSVKNISTK